MSTDDDLVYLQLTDLAGALRRVDARLPPGIGLRTADPAADLGCIAELYGAAFDMSSPGKVTSDEVARLAQHPGLRANGVFLAFDGDLAVGLGVGRVDVPAPGGTAHQGAIELLAVRPGYRRRGIGRALIRAVLIWLASQHVATVGVSAEDPTLLAVLKQYGFREAAPPYGGA